MAPATDVTESQRIWVEGLNRGDLATEDRRELVRGPEK